MNRAVTADLFTPIRLGRLDLPNRIVMAPMTRARAGTGGAPNCLNATYYRQRASAGLIITEATQVSPQGGGFPGTPGIHSFEQISGWRQVTDAVHDAGGRIFLQLWHVGRISHPSMQPGGALPVAPSAIAPAGEVFTSEGPKPYVTPRALEIAEIAGVVEQFRRGAANAMVAGFDGVEVHAANGYLIDQFLRDGTNRRGDGYGGSIDNRARLLLEVMAAVCEVWQGDRVSVRLSPAGTFNDMRDSDPDATFTRVAELLNPLKLACLHVVEDGAYDVARVRRAFHGRYIANGGYDFARATAAISSGGADLVSFGKLYISNPDLARRFAMGARLAEADTGTFYGGDAAGYIDYPALDQPTATPG
ncbi:MAG TPA: alkene reductase [Gammaproteobacteria bacterium]|jgi:N-ethylmaleimide reductase